MREGDVSDKANQAPLARETAEITMSDAQLQELRIDKLQLEVEALRAEKKDKERNFWLKILTSATGPIAVLGLISSLVLGIMDNRTAVQQNLEDTYQKEITHLGSKLPSERLTGITGLGLLLANPSQKARQPEALSVLANALAVEKDPIVSQVLTDTLEELAEAPPLTSKPMIATVLPILVQRNRSLTELHHFTAEELTSEGAQASPELLPILATGHVISSIVRVGAQTRNFSGISCIACDFSGSNLAKANFWYAIVPNSKFNFANLRWARFDNAVVDGSTFAHADLTHAFITDSRGSSTGSVRERALLDSEIRYFDKIGEVSRSYKTASPFPSFRCANLEAADFTGRIIFGLRIAKQYGYGATFINLRGANIDNAVLSNVRLLYVNNETGLTEEDVPFHGTSWCSKTKKLAGQPPESQSEVSFCITSTDNESIMFSSNFAPPASDAASEGLHALADDLRLAYNVSKARLPRGVDELIHASPSIEHSTEDCSDKLTR